MKLNFTSLVCGSAAIFYNLLAAFPAHAVDVTWDLNGVSFADGSTATGDFIYNDNVPIQADITLTEAGGSQVTFTSGDLGTTFASSNSGSSINFSSGYRRLVLCSNPSGSTCPSSSTVLVLSSNDSFGAPGGTGTFSVNDGNPSFYYNGTSTFKLASGGVNQIPFNVPVGEGSVLLGGVLAMGAVRRLKNYSSSTKIANSTSGKAVD